MGATGKEEIEIRGLSHARRVIGDWIGALLTAGVCSLAHFPGIQIYNLQVDQLLIVSIAFAAFHRGTRAGLASAAIAVLSLALEANRNPHWSFSSEGMADAALVLISLPLVFLAGNLRRKLLRSANENAMAERRHAQELRVALDRAKDAEETLARLNLDLETTVKHRTHEVQQAVEALIDAEQQLSEATEEASFLLRALDLHAGVAITDADFVIRFVNQRFVDITGYEREEVIGRPASDSYLTYDAQTSFEVISGLVRSGQSHKVEIPFTRKDGSAVWLEAAFTPQIGPKGELVRSVVMFTDISERKHSEHELVRFSRAIWQSPASVVITDKNGSIEYVNPTFEEVTGYSLKEVFGKNPKILKSGRTEKDVYRDMWSQIAAGEVWTGELCNRKKSGEIFWEHASISGIQDESGEIVSYVAVKVDITAQRLAQIEIEESHLEVVKRLALATEFRDDDTGAHVQRIGYFAAVLGEACGLSQDECETLTWASALHDIGKLAIPDAILLKPGKLTDEEYAVMRTHATLGAKMLEGGRGPILEQAEIIARTHHERWDGTGYPAGIKGEDIPLVGRIVAICDVFDALTSERPYKRAWTFGEAMAEIERCAGTHFDPRLAKLFVANGSKIQLILQMLSNRAENDDEGDLLAA